MQLDNKFTEEIQAWLETPADDRDLMKGAEILFRLNRNRALYNTLIRKPEKYSEKMDYEMRKYLRIRLDGLTRAQVGEMEKKVVPSAMEIVVSADNGHPESIHKGKRADHDTLPEKIRNLWDDNFEVYKTIKHLFEELKGMAHLEPCDRYDKLQLLAAADSRYRNNLAVYDSYDAEAAAAQALEEEQAAEAKQENARLRGAARKGISKWRKTYDTVTDEEPRKMALAKVLEYVGRMYEAGGTVSEETAEWLDATGAEWRHLTE